MFYLARGLLSAKRWKFQREVLFLPHLCHHINVALVNQIHTGIGEAFEFGTADDIVIDHLYSIDSFPFPSILLHFM